MILTGAGRAFCAGQDLRERLEPGAAPLATEIRERYNPIILAMRRLEKPIVGAINGIAAGAGASLAFACDIRIAAEGASFLLAFGRVGLIPDSGATWFLPRLVGTAKAAELAMTGEPLTAADAERFGLVASVVPLAELAEAARALATRLAAGAPRAIALTKRALDRGRGVDARGGPRVRGVASGNRRRDRRSRGGHRRLRREASAAVHRRVGPADRHGTPLGRLIDDERGAIRVIPAADCRPGVRVERTQLGLQRLRESHQSNPL